MRETAAVGGGVPDRSKLKTRYPRAGRRRFFMLAFHNCTPWHTHVQEPHTFNVGASGRHHYERRGAPTAYTLTSSTSL